MNIKLLKNWTFKNKKIKKDTVFGVGRALGLELINDKVAEEFKGETPENKRRKEIENHNIEVAVKEELQVDEAVTSALKKRTH